MSHSLRPGYAYRLEPRQAPHKEDPTGERRALYVTSELWETVVIDEAEIDGSNMIGARNIDGARCRVFRSSGGNFYAQTCAYTEGH